MKTKFGFLLAVMTILLLSFTACKDDDDDNPVINEDLMSEEISAAFGSSSFGVNSILGKGGTVAAENGETLKNYDNLYGNNEQITCTITNPEGSSVTYNYTLVIDYSFIITPPSFIPDFVWNYTLNGSFEGERIASTIQSSGNLVYGNLNPLETNYLMNGDYTRTGTTIAKKWNNKTYTCTINVNFVDVEIVKTTHEVISGSANFTITGTGFNSEAFSYTGTVIYNSDGTILLTINTHSYIINLENGNITKM